MVPIHYRSGTEETPWRCLQSAGLWVRYRTTLGCVGGWAVYVGLLITTSTLHGTAVDVGVASCGLIIAMVGAVATLLGTGLAFRRTGFGGLVRSAGGVTVCFANGVLSLWNVAAPASGRVGLFR